MALPVYLVAILALRWVNIDWILGVLIAVPLALLIGVVYVLRKRRLSDTA